MKITSWLGQGRLWGDPKETLGHFWGNLIRAWGEPKETLRYCEKSPGRNMEYAEEFMGRLGKTLGKPGETLGRPGKTW